MLFQHRIYTLNVVFIINNSIDYNEASLLKGLVDKVNIVLHIDWLLNYLYSRFDHLPVWIRIDFNDTEIYICLLHCFKGKL